MEMEDSWQTRVPFRNLLRIHPVGWLLRKSAYPWTFGQRANGHSTPAANCVICVSVCRTCERLSFDLRALNLLSTPKIKQAHYEDSQKSKQVSGPGKIIEKSPR